MSKFHTTINEWGLVSGIRQAQSDLIVVNEPRSPFSPEARKGQLFVVVEADGDITRGRQACALVAQTICETFYADGSTSITSSLRQALKISNDETAAFEGALSFAHLLTDEPPRVAALKRFLAERTSADARQLMAALVGCGLMSRRFEAVLERLAELEQTEVAPPPLLSGDDLMAAGMKPGPLFKRVLDAVYDAQLEGGIETKDEALAMAKGLVTSPSS